MWFRTVNEAEAIESLILTLTTNKSPAENKTGSSNTIEIDEPADFQRVRLVHGPDTSPSQHEAALLRYITIISLCYLPLTFA